MEIDQIEERVTIKLDTNLLKDKDITPEEVRDKASYRRSTVKVDQSGNEIHVKPDKEEPELSDLQKN